MEITSQVSVCASIGARWKNFSKAKVLLISKCIVNHFHAYSAFFRRPPLDADPIASGIRAGLDFLHNLGLVHGDIKPGKMMRIVLSSLILTPAAPSERNQVAERLGGRKNQQQLRLRMMNTDLTSSPSLFGENMMVRILMLGACSNSIYFGPLYSISQADFGLLTWIYAFHGPLQPDAWGIYDCSSQTFPLGVRMRTSVNANFWILIIFFNKGDMCTMR